MEFFSEDHIPAPLSLQSRPLQDGAQGGQSKVTPRLYASVLRLTVGILPLAVLAIFRPERLRWV